MSTAEQRCTRCEVTKPVNEFPVAPLKRSGYDSWCKQCRREASTKRYHNDLEASRAYHREWDKTHREKRRWSNHKRYHAIKNDEERYQMLREKRKRWEQSLRRRVIAAYGDVCTCCGEAQSRFLSLEHLKGGGTQHRKSTGQTSVLREALSMPIPNDTYTVLCYNCNIGKAQNGGICPHEEERMAIVA